MRRKRSLIRWMLAATLSATFTLSPACGLAAREEKLTSAASQEATNRATSGRSLPAALSSVLPEVKAKSRIPVLLPSKLPDPIGKAKHATIGTSADGYGITLYYELGIGDAGFAASFSAQSEPGYHPWELGNVREVKLSHGMRGFFRPVSCGGSCAPAFLMWEEGGVLYQVSLELSPTVSEQDQEKTITAVVNSAILAGPR